MDLGLEGRRVLVTGSSRGIGRGVAEAFLAEGARVALTGRTAETLERTRAELARRYPDRVVGVRADLAGPEAEVAQAVADVGDALGGLDILVANVGAGSGKPGLDADQDEWERALRVNLTGAATVIRHAVPLIGGGGAVVLVSSIAGLDVLPAPLAYSAAKAGVLSLGLNLGRQLAGRGIRVNVVSPGNVLHEGGSWERRLASDRAGTLAYIEREVPLNRFATPADVAAAVVFLASERAAGFITGTNLTVDGGQTCRG
jgi:3-oxoacyl-[acyl-carrier protein] reductase